MPIGNLFRVSKVDRNNFVSKIIESSAPRTDFYFLVVLSTLIVALGIMADNVVLVIGGMLVTPLLSPILAVALGVVINDNKVIMRSVRIFLTAFGLSFIVAFVLGVFSSVKVEDINLIRIMEPSLFTFFISVVAGLAAAYTWVKPELNETLPGISITVTLIPPLTAIGLSMANGNFVVFGNAFKVLLLNVFGIIVASLVVFSLMDFYRAKQRVIEEIKEEEEIIKKEKEEIILNKE